MWFVASIATLLAIVAFARALSLSSRDDQLET